MGGCSDRVITHLKRKRGWAFGCDVIGYKGVHKLFVYMLCCVEEVKSGVSVWEKLGGDKWMSNASLFPQQVMIKPPWGKTVKCCQQKEETEDLVILWALQKMSRGSLWIKREDKRSVCIIHWVGQTNLDVGVLLESEHLLLNTSRLQCDMFAVLSSSDVWPTVIHFKHLACCCSLSLSILSRFQLQGW